MAPDDDDIRQNLLKTKRNLNPSKAYGISSVHLSDSLGDHWGTKGARATNFHWLYKCEQSLIFFSCPTNYTPMESDLSDIL